MQYKVAIIGAGNISSGYDDPSSPYILTHAHAVLKSAVFKLKGFYDTDINKLACAANKWRCAELKTLKEIEKQADVIIIAVPDEFHYDILLQCADFSSIKAIIAEKPITKTLEQAKKIEELYEKKGIQLFINYSRRYVAEFNKLKEWIQKQAGRLIFGNCYYGKGVSHNGSHLVNLMDYLFDGIELRSVGKGVYDFYNDDPSVEFELLSGKSSIYFHIIPCNIVTEFGFELFFENGKIRYTGENETIEYYKIQESEVYAGEKNYRFAHSDKINVNSAMVGLYENVGSVLLGQSKIRCSVKEAGKTLSICEEVKYRSVNEIK